MSGKQSLTPEQLRDEYARALAPLHEESDRGCALVAAAFIDEALGQLLRHRFEKNPEAATAAQWLLRPDGPLGSFWSRAHLCLALGLIDPPVLKELDILRRIRNRFAHQYGPSSFNDNAIRDLIQELLNRDMTSPGNGQAMMATMSPRDAFIRQVIGLMGYVANCSTYFRTDPLGIFKQMYDDGSIADGDLDHRLRKLLPAVLLQKNRAKPMSNHEQSTEGN